MAEEKKGFILYADQKELFDQLPNDKAGELIKHIFSYVNDETPTTEDLLINLAFTPIKQQFKRDLEKWETTKQGRSKAGKASAEARRNKKQQELTNSTNVKSVQQTSTNPTVTVNDNVNVTVNDKVSVKVKDIKEVIPKIQKEFSAPVLSCYNNCLLFFPEEIRPKLAKGVFNWRDTIEKLNRIDKIPFEVIEEITKKTRLDPFWSKNFLSLTKLRQTQKNSELKYIQVFNENIKNNGQSTRTMQEVATDAFNSEVGRNFRFK